MTRALLSMQDRVVGLEKGARPSAPPATGVDAGLTARIAALEQQLAVALDSFKVANDGVAPAEAAAIPAAAAATPPPQDPSADWGAPAAASFASQRSDTKEV